MPHDDPGRPQTAGGDDTATHRRHRRPAVAAPGATMRQAVDGLAGIGPAIPGRFGLAAVAVNPPGRNGRALGAALRPRPLPVVTFGSICHGGDRTAAHRAGADPDLVEPPRPLRPGHRVRLIMGDRVS